MDEIIKELVNMADEFDRQGKVELAAAVDDAIKSFAARPKAPLKKMDEKHKKDLLGFLGTVCENLQSSVSSLEELSKRLRYFGIDNEVKGLKLGDALKSMKELSDCMDGASRKFYEFSFGKKPSKDYLKDLKEKKDDGEQKSEDPFSFARFNDEQKQHVPVRNTPEEDASLVGADKEAPTEEDMENFWEGTDPDAFEDAADDGAENA